MSGSLIKSALRALALNGAIRPGVGLCAYMDDNKIEYTAKGKNIVMGKLCREDLWSALKRDYQVPRGTTPESWKNLPRSDSLDLTTNEKVTYRPVRTDRVAVKSLKGHSIVMGQDNFFLPPGISFDIDAGDADFFRQHKTVILIENWEAFQRIDRLSFDVDPDLRSSLIVFRGEIYGYNVSAARRFLADLNAPVYVFPDADPAGLKLAMDYPGYAGLVLPPKESLIHLFASGRGQRDRYTDQLSVASSSLDSSTDPEIQDYWGVVKKAGSALPQEEFVRGPAN